MSDRSIANRATNPPRKLLDPRGRQRPVGRSRDVDLGQSQVALDGHDEVVQHLRSTERLSPFPSGHGLQPSKEPGGIVVTVPQQEEPNRKVEGGRQRPDGGGRWTGPTVL